MNTPASSNYPPRPKNPHVRDVEICFTYGEKFIVEDAIQICRIGQQPEVITIETAKGHVIIPVAQVRYVAHGVDLIPTY